MSYAELLAATSRMGNALRADGVRAGDRVCICMPLSLEGIAAMLACARIGAVQSVVYAGLGATALRDRIREAGAAVVIGADVTQRRRKAIDLKKIWTMRCAICPAYGASSCGAVVSTTRRLRIVSTARPIIRPYRA